MYIQPCYILYTYIQCIYSLVTYILYTYIQCIYSLVTYYIPTYNVYTAFSQHMTVKMCLVLCSNANPN